jgi:hypothetical protein
MTRLFKRLIALITVSLLIGPSFAAIWKTDITIKNIRLMGTDGGTITFTTIEPVFNPFPCPGVNGFYEIRTTDLPKQMMQVLLAAKLSGEKASILVSDTTCGSYNHPRVEQVLIGPFN